MRKTVILYSLLLLSLFGCSDKEEDVKSDQYSLALSGSTIENVFQDYEEREVVVRTDVDWQVEQSDTDPWFSVYPMKGHGRDTLTVYISETEEPRSGSFYIYLKDDSSIREQVNITQTLRDDNSDEDTGKEKNRAVGYGYDVFDKYARNASIKGRILDFSVTRRMANEEGYDDGILEFPLEEANYEERTGSSLTEISNSFKVTTGLTANVMCFSSELELNYTTEKLTNEYSEFGSWTTYYCKKKNMLNRTFWDKTTLRECLTDRAKATIDGTDGTSLKYLVDTYGTHLILSAYQGGRYTYSMTLDRSKVNTSTSIGGILKAAVKSAFVNVDLSVSVSEMESLKKSKEGMSYKIEVTGGNAELFNVTNGKPIDIAPWAKGFYDGTEASVLINFDPESLYPIWELCSDENRGRAIKNFIENEWSQTKGNWEIDYQKVKIKVPTNWGDTSVKEVLFNGKRIAEICYEYVPLLNGTSRSTVIYPVVNGKTDITKGFFVGDNTHSCGYLSWSENISTFKELSGMGKVSEVWINGSTFTINLNQPDNRNMGEIHDEYLIDKRPGVVAETYPLVKIGDHFITARNLHASVGTNGSRISYDAVGKKYYYPSVSIKISNIAPTGWTVFPPVRKYGSGKDKWVDSFIAIANNSGEIFCSELFGLMGDGGGWYDYNNHKVINEFSEIYFCTGLTLFSMSKGSNLNSTIATRPIPLRLLRD